MVSKGAMSFLPLIFLLVTGYAAAQEEPLAGRFLILGTKETPPFVMKAEDGSWTGLSIDLWRRIADELELTYEFRERDLKGLLEGVENGTLDGVIGTLTITPKRETAFDFTHPFHTTGLGIAAAAKTGSPWLSVMKRVFSLTFLRVVSLLGVLLLGVGLLVWMFERRRNPQQFGGGTARGIGAGFWWSAVTMTTVGYGDKAPVTAGGRLVALIWMFAAIIIISSFTAAIASALTVTQLEFLVQGPQDLPKVRVGTIPDSTSAAYLQAKGISFRPFGTVREGMRAVAEDKIDALVYDAPILRYLARQEYQGIVHVLPNVFLRQDYAFAFSSGSPLREPVNRVLLEQISEPWWQEKLQQLLGI